MRGPNSLALRARLLLTPRMPLEINGFTISDDAIKQEAQRLGQEVQQRFPWLDPIAQTLQAEDLAKDRFIEHRLLWEDAQEAILDLSESDIDDAYRQILKRHGGEKKFLEKFKIDARSLENVKREIADDLRFQRYLAQLRERISEPTKEEVQGRYEKDLTQFKHPDQYKASHIVMHTNDGQDPAEAKRRIEAAQQRLQAGDAFEAIADEDSDCPGKGGDLDWFPEGHMVAEFEKVVFKMEIGAISEIFETPFGFHIARLDDKKEGETEPLDKVAESIKSVIANERRDTLFKERIDALKEKATIVRN